MTDPLAIALSRARPQDDLDRALALPIEHQRRSPARFQGTPGAPPLRDSQEDFLWEVALAVSAGSGRWGQRGAVGIVGCGHGKTLMAQLAPQIANAQRPILLLPASLRMQLRADVAYWSRWYPLALGNEDRWVTYEQLSGPKSVALIERLAPDMIVMDEAHMLGNADSARWKRLARFISTHPEVRVCALSGTLAARKLGEMAHILHACLRDWNPLPVDRNLPHLAACVDVGSEPNSDDLMVGKRVVEWAERTDREENGPTDCPYPTGRQAIRSATHARLRTARGIVFATGVAADVSLRISVASGPAMPEPMAAALTRIRTKWELPDGTELVDAIETHRHFRSLAMGYFQRWVPGTVPPHWLEARRAWAREVRRVIAFMPGASQLALDSPALVEEAARKGSLDYRAQVAWDHWAIQKRGVIVSKGEPDVRPSPYQEWPEPPTETVWIDGADEYLESTLRHLCPGAALTRAGRAAGHPVAIPPGAGHVTGKAAAGDPTAQGGCVVWVGSPQVGAGLEGMGVAYHGADSEAPSGGMDVVAASHRVHGKGWNGQAYSRAVILEMPDGPANWEQLLARHHRPGAQRDVEVTILCATLEHVEGLRKALTAAKFAETTLGTPQRLLLADWSGFAAGGFRNG